MVVRKCLVFNTISDKYKMSNPQNYMYIYICIKYIASLKKNSSLRITGVSYQLLVIRVLFFITFAIIAL